MNGNTPEYPSKYKYAIQERKNSVKGQFLQLKAGTDGSLATFPSFDSVIGELRASAKLEKYLPLNYQAKLESTLKYDLDGTLEFLASLLGKGGVGVPTTEEERIKTDDE